MGDNRVCAQCEPWESETEQEPGYCDRCGFFFDLYGMRLLEPWITCKVHSPIRASCPHSGSLE